jgi:hypothetical protein
MLANSQALTDASDFGNASDIFHVENPLQRLALVARI